LANYDTKQRRRGPTMVVIRRQLPLIAFALAYRQEVSSFTTSQTRSRQSTSLEAKQFKCDDGAASQQRRAVLSTFIAVTSTALTSPIAANAGLLDDYGTDPTENRQPDKQKKEQAKNKGKPVSNMEPNLRSNYYYPTNKVRYLPRIKKCSDAIPGVAVAIGSEDWEAIGDFAKTTADDTILPLKLYVSSLGGGGTNVKVGFAAEMATAAKRFEKSQAVLVKAVSKQDTAKSSEALEDMAESLLAYRTSGRLLGPDGGGDIPSVDEIRRSTKRFRGEAFEAKIKDRDARVAATKLP